MTDHVELTLPARPDLLVLARMTVGAVAARAEMPVDDIEDLRLAIDELCLSAVGDRAGGRLELRYDWDPAGMEVSCTFRPSDPDEHRVRSRSRRRACRHVGQPCRPTSRSGSSTRS